MVFTAVDREAREGRDYRLLADILAGLVDHDSANASVRSELAPRMGRLPGGAQRPEAGRAGVPPGPNLAVLQEALADAGFEPRFRRRSAKTVEITLRECPFRDLLDEHRELVCAVHRGLLEGMLAASRPADGADGVRRADRANGLGLPHGGSRRLKRDFVRTASNNLRTETEVRGVRGPMV